MTVCPEDRGDPAIGEMAERHLLARCLGVKVDNDRSQVVAEPMIAKNVVEPSERVIERIHEEPAHQIDDQHAAPTYPMHPPARTRRAFWEICRPQEAGVTVDIGNDLTLVPDMVAGRQDVDAAIVQLAAEPFG